MTMRKETKRALVIFFSIGATLILLLTGIHFLALEITKREYKGQVIDLSTGEPIEGAKVKIYKVTYPSGFWFTNDVIYHEEEYLRTIHTDSSGWFRIRMNRASGDSEYRFEISKEGYIPQYAYPYEFPDINTEYLYSDYMEEKTFFSPRCSLQGKVTDEQGAPVKGATVAIIEYSPSYGDSGYYRRMENAAQTDVFGNYRIDILKAGYSDIIVCSTGYEKAVLRDQFLDPFTDNNLNATLAIDGGELFDVEIDVTQFSDIYSETGIMGKLLLCFEDPENDDNIHQIAWYDGDGFTSGLPKGVYRLEVRFLEYQAYGSDYEIHISNYSSYYYDSIEVNGNISIEATVYHRYSVV
ncbi:MAG: carboxypeptidase-like regulatory domain-containing protein [Thermoplasmatota archaeon]